MCTYALWGEEGVGGWHQTLRKFTPQMLKTPARRWQGPRTHVVCVPVCKLEKATFMVCLQRSQRLPLTGSATNRFPLIGAYRPVVRNPNFQMPAEDTGLCRQRAHTDHVFDLVTGTGHGSLDRGSGVYLCTYEDICQQRQRGILVHMRTFVTRQLWWPRCPMMPRVQAAIGKARAVSPGQAHRPGTASAGEDGHPGSRGERKRSFLLLSLSLPSAGWGRPTPRRRELCSTEPLHSLRSGTASETRAEPVSPNAWATSGPVDGRVKPSITRNPPESSFPFLMEHSSVTYQSSRLPPSALRGAHPGCGSVPTALL